MNNRQDNINKDIDESDFKPVILSRPVVNTFRAKVISYFLTLLIPTVGVGGFLYFLKDNLANKTVNSSSITNKSKNSAFIDMLTRDYIKVANMMGIMSNPATQDKKEKEPVKIASVVNKKVPNYSKSYRKKKIVKHKKKYVSTVYKPGETKMKIIIVDKK